MQSPMLVTGLGAMGHNYLSILTKDHGIKEYEITAVDQDSTKIEACWQKWPEIAYFTDLTEALASRPHRAAFTLVNTPSHYNVLQAAIAAGIKHHLVEKPLVYTVEEAREIEALSSQASFYTGYVINFSRAVAHLRDLMNLNGLQVREVRGRWGKNRCPDDRPTPGDLEDETTHAIATALALMEGQKILGLEVAAHLSYLPFVNPAAQAKAHAFDPSFPLEVTSSSVVTLQLKTEAPQPVMVAVTSSFISFDQHREVEVTLGPKNGQEISHLAKLVFDTGPKNEEDHLYFKTVQTKKEDEVQHEVFPAKEKLQDQIKAFLEGIQTGYFDPRLTDRAAADLLVRITAVAQHCHRDGMRLSI